MAIQVSYNPKKTNDTWERETSALIKLSKQLDCARLLVLTYEQEGTVEISGRTIELLPVWKCMLKSTV